MDKPLENIQNEFMNIGIDATSLGMSSAVTSHTTHVNTGYWNPADLLNLEDHQRPLMLSSYFSNVANDAVYLCAGVGNFQPNFGVDFKCHSVQRDYIGDQSVAIYFH